jgi:hypothetical protein
MDAASFLFPQIPTVSMSHNNPSKGMGKEDWYRFRLRADGGERRSGLQRFREDKCRKPKALRFNWLDFAVATSTPTSLI